MALGLPSGYNVTPIGYTKQDGVLFHIKDDMSTFLNLTSTTDITYNSPITVTTNPVMSGANVADNFSRQPKTIQISGVVVAGYEGSFLTTKSTGVVEDFVATVESWRDKKYLVRVLCKDGITLDNAVIQSFQAKKDKNIANGLNIDMTFIQIDIVKEAERTTVQSNANGSKTTGGHAVTTKDKAVTSKKQNGRTASKATDATIKCKILNSITYTQAGKIVGARGERQNCNKSYTPAGYNGQKEDSYEYNPNNAVVSRVKNALNAQGVNINHAKD